MMTYLMQSHAFVTVGTDEKCDLNVSSFQFAIQNNDEVRITNQATFPAVAIINQSVIIRGGYDNCMEAETNSGNNFPLSTLSGQDNQTVMELKTTAAGGHIFRSVTLEYLELMDGLTSGTNLAGGLDILGNLEVTTTNVLINNNEASSHGGGVYVFGGNGAKLTMNNTQITSNNASVGAGMVISSGAEVIINGGNINNNTATDNGGGILVTSGSQLALIDTLVTNNSASLNGGGIHCSSSDLSINKESRVSDNEADFGAGLYSNTNCNALIESGDDEEIGNTMYGFNANKADVFGGALYALNSQVIFKGSASHHANLLFNWTDEDNPQAQGGAIYARGAEANVTLINARIHGNDSTFGSAITSTEGAKVKVRKTTGNCFNNESCSLISENEALFGTLYALSCGTIDVYMTTIKDNIAADGAVGYFLGNSSDLCESTLEGNLIYGNKDELDETSSLFLLDRQATLEFAFNTVSDNLTDNIFKLSNTDNSEQNLKFNSSIIWNAPATIFTEVATNSYSGNCFLIHENQNLPNGLGNLMIVEDPVFADPANNNFQLSFNSRPIDYCDTSLYQPIHHDINSIPRGLQFAPPVLGNYDMGAHEYDNGEYFNDVIFYDSLE
ncbi:MAG: hypothetical protein AB8B80_06120 [Marinicellaceae bacterium]